MNLDWEFASRIQCKDSERLKCLQLILTIVSFSEKARREGLLALEDDVNELSSNFLKLGIQLIVDGTDPELVKTILETKILAANSKGYDLLSKAIMLDGVLCIQNGDNPRIVKEKLFAYFPDEFLESKAAQAYLSEDAYEPDSEES